MKLPEFCIKRPVFATVINLVILLIGIIAYQRLTVREYPNIDEPVVTVDTTYQGASAEIMESQITQPLEESLAGIEGIDYIKSVSRSESSQITLKFSLTRNVEAAASDVRDRVSQARSKLPDDVDEPIIEKVEADAQPIIYMVFTSEFDSALQTSDYVDRFVKNRLQTLPGISEVRIFAERKPSMRVWLDPTRLAAYNVTVQDVEDALRAQNVEIPAGRIESQGREFTVLNETGIQTPEQFENLILANANGHLVRLSEVGRAEIGAYDERVRARYNGQIAVALGIIKQATANPLEVSQAIRKELPSIGESLPAGMKLDIAYDSSTFIQSSIDNVYSAVFEAIVLVLLVIFFFLRSVRATIIPIVTIPISLIGACALMYALNFSMNTLTLLAFVLAIGLVVDDAIVMLENIHRHIEEGLSPMKAAIKGSGEIAFAVLAMTITLAAVYVPVALQTGRTGRLFTEFALSLAGAVLVSGFVALSLSPMLCSRLLLPEKGVRHGFVYQIIEGFIGGLVAGYRALLSFVLRMRFLVVIVLVAVAGSAYLLFNALKTEVSPVEDRGVVLAVAVAPEGSTLEYTASYVDKMAEIFAKVPESDGVFTLVGYPTVTNAFVPLRLKDWNERDRTQMDIAAGLFGPLWGLPGVMAFPLNPPSLGQGFTSKAAEIEILSSGTYDELNEVVEQFLQVAGQDPRLNTVESDLKLSKPELRVTIDRNKAADLGIPVDTIGRTIETMLGGRDVTRFKRESKQYDVVVKLADEGRRTPDQAKAIFVRSASGEMVSVANLVSIRESVAPKELNRWNQLRAATITANVNPGFTAGDGLKAMQEIAAKVLPNSMQIDYGGQSRELIASSQGGLIIFGLALAFIYLVLAAQFESFVDPFIIMMSVPLAITGALIAMKITGGSLNVYSQIGLITLIGLITKHGILIVEFANHRQEEGLDRTQAVLEAATLRLRPILMTTGAMVLGSFPLAFATGAGAEARRAIGAVVVGGLSFGSLLTLFVVPVIYSLLARKRQVEGPVSDSVIARDGMSEAV